MISLQLVLICSCIWYCVLAKNSAKVQGIKTQVGSGNLANNARNKIVYNNEREKTEEHVDLKEEINPDWPDEQKILHQLLREYDTAARPVFNASIPVVVKFSLSFIQLSDMVKFQLFESNLPELFLYLYRSFKDEKNQVLTSNIWIEQVIQNCLVSFERYIKL